MLVDLLFTITGIIMLYFGAELLVNGSLALSKRWRVRPMLIGILVVGLGTSSPELIVSIEAALIGSGEVAAGNIIGSNISNLALILGIAALISPIGVHKSLFRKELPVLAVISLLSAWMMMDGYISRLEGLALIVMLGVYLFHAIRTSRSSVSVPGEAPTAFEKRSSIAVSLITLGGLLVLLAGAHLMITGSLGLSRHWGWNEAVIGLTVVAVGTSLPELATAVVAGFRKQTDLLMGALIGSNVMNLLFVLAVTALVRPIEMPNIMPADLIVMVVLVLLLLPFSRTGWVISRAEGGFLLLVYALFFGFLLVR